MWAFLINLSLVMSKTRGYNLLCHPPRERSQSRPNPDGQKDQKNNFQLPRRRPTQGSRVPPNKRRNLNALKMKKDTTIVESLMFFNLLCDLEQNLPNVFNKLNNTEYTSVVVNLSKYSLTSTEKNVLSKGLGFLPHSRGSSLLAI